MDFSLPVSHDRIEKAMAGLKANGVDSFFVEDEAAVKQKLLELIPAGANVMNMSSVTLDAININSVLFENGTYHSVRNVLMDKLTAGDEKRRQGAAPDFAVGSVHAATEDGKLMIASNTGSQLPAYAYGAAKVIFIVGAQKIVKDLEEGFKRIYEYTLPLESERAKKAYGVPGSAVNKMLIINKEVQPDRLTVIFVNRTLGF